MLNILVNFIWFLTLASSFAENNICCWSFLIFCIAFNSDYAVFFGMLEIKSMSFCNFAIDSFFNPNYFVYDLVAPFFNHFAGDSILGIDGPNKYESISLKLNHWNMRNNFIIELWVGNCYTSGRLRRGQLPRGVHHYNIKEPSPKVHLFVCKFLMINGGTLKSKNLISALIGTEVSVTWDFLD